MILLIPFVCTYLHVYLDPASARAYASNWRPQIVADSVMSVSGLDMYTRARISLSDKRCVGAILQHSVSGHPCMYVLERNDSERLQISCILWSPWKHMLKDMKALRVWYEMRFSDELYGGARMQNVERDTWYLTSYDA